NIFGKQLKQARHLINIGSYNDAIDILKPIIDRQEETWDTYLLMGAAYLGLGELDYAETYSEMGLAMNGKVPQLWLQCAIVEQQRGKHEAALKILNEAEKLAPDIPEMQLNIGYSYDAIGNQKLSVKAYNSFLKLTEGNSAYMMVRYKVLERLRNLK
ncbi:MAG: tetratricopeptide repeat protein, partial [Gammaproteobacteria bacterium]|nr:tetratricopeptide repeat protein [Gammaproteobacteria bacterium]